MAKQFYRKVGVCAILVCAAALSVAQKPVKQRTGPRAISLLEMDDKGEARLIPVTILIQSKFYDGALYQGNPVPLVLEPGNVYDVLQANVPIGLFTTDQPKQVRGAWISEGTWKPQSAEPPTKNAKVSITADSDDDRPVLKRHKEGEPKSSGPDDVDRPTLKKPKPSADSASGSTPKPTAVAPQDLSRDTNQNDPDRPLLRKTKPGVNPTEGEIKLPAPAPPALVAAPSKVAPQSGAPQLKSYVAVSDAQKTDYRPFGFELKGDEKAHLTAKMQKIAALNLKKWALAHGGVQLAPNLVFTDFDLRAYDVDYSNNPELIFTASYSPTATAKTKPITYYLTVVAREDSTGEANPIFAQVTDSTRLDAYSRLELVDAVDAEGYGRGSLLFREYTDTGKSFILYRVDPYNLTKLFEGASGE